MAIPGFLLYFVRKRSDLPFPRVFYLFGMFIIGCGMTHFSGALLFWTPMFNLGLTINVITALVSWATVFYLIPLAPIALKLRTPVELDIINAQLEKKHKQYKSVTDAMIEAVITTDIDGKITECNAAVKKLFDYSPVEMIGKSVAVIIPPELVGQHLGAIESLKQGREPRILGEVLELEAVRRDGDRFPIAISINRVIVDSMVYYTAVIRDITKRREQERTIKVLVETLQLRLKAVEGLNFSLVHDLGAPLRTIEGMSEILLEDYADKLDDAGKDYIHRIVLASGRQRQLIKDMLRLSRITQPDVELKKEQVNLSHMAEDIMRWHYELEPQRKHEVIIEPNVFVEADKDFIEMLLTNLLSNAWKFTGKKEITRIEFGKVSIHGETVYYVKDNGAGFDMSKADRLFKPFSRLHDKRDFEGSGVGLSIVKQVVTLHDGRVWAEGKVGEGAAFYLTIGKQTNGK